MRYINIILSVLMIFYCSKAYGEDEKQKQTQFVEKI